MNIGRTLLYVIVFCFCIITQSCFSQGTLQESMPKNYKSDPRAILLNDSALKIYKSQAGGEIKAILLLNKATAIDSNCFEAYWNKSALLMDLKRYSEAIVAGKQMIRLNTKNPDLYPSVGIGYELIGDSVSAAYYYQESIVLTNSILDTMKRTNQYYPWNLYRKGITMVLLGHQQEGIELTNEAYDLEIKQANRNGYNYYMNLLNKTRGEILESMKHINGH